MKVREVRLSFSSLSIIIKPLSWLGKAQQDTDKNSAVLRKHVILPSDIIWLDRFGQTRIGIMGTHVIQPKCCGRGNHE
ncbi:MULTISPECIES: hypothetical protein [unclassified Paenibacillus]|uniref:hypothetical protein n=1 Tax=unclassified Paenibacillus TaxID=185978 RepID=UPI003F7F7F84